MNIAHSYARGQCSSPRQSQVSNLQGQGKIRKYNFGYGAPRTHGTKSVVAKGGWGLAGGGKGFKNKRHPGFGIATGTGQPTPNLDIIADTVTDEESMAKATSQLKDIAKLLLDTPDGKSLEEKAQQMQQDENELKAINERIASMKRQWNFEERELERELDAGEGSAWKQSQLQKLSKGDKAAQTDEHLRQTLASLKEDLE